MSQPKGRDEWYEYIKKLPPVDQEKVWQDVKKLLDPPPVVRAEPVTWEHIEPILRDTATELGWEYAVIGNGPWEIVFGKETFRGTDPKILAENILRYFRKILKYTQDEAQKTQSFWRDKEVEATNDLDILEETLYLITGETFDE